jgi:hypothetical protein
MDDIDCKACPKCDLTAPSRVQAAARGEDDVPAMKDGPRPLGRVRQRTSRPFYSRMAFRILLLVAFAWPFCFSGAFRALINKRDDVASWLPARYPETRLLQWFQQHFADEQFILVSWEGCTLGESAAEDDQRLRLLVKKLFPTVSNEELAARRAPPQYFKKAITGRDAIERLTSPPIKLAELEARQRLRGSLVGRDLKQTCLLLVLSSEGMQDVRKTVAHVRRVACGECGIPEADLHMGGPPVDNAAIDEAGQTSLYRVAGLAVLIGSIISWWCLRSARLILMVFAGGLMAGAASMAIVWFSGGTLNAILLTMPSLVYVATISGAIHLANYYRDELRRGVSPEEAPGRAMQHAWLPLCLATLTTATGLLTLCYSELVPIQNFGLYSAIGVVVSAVILFLYLPAAFQLWPLQPQQEEQEALFDPFLSKRWRLVGWGVIHRHWLAAFATLAILAACGYGMTRIKTSIHLMRLFPPDARILADYRWLEERLGELVPLEVVVKINQDPAVCPLNFLERMELVGRIQQQMQNVPEVGSSLSAVTFAPRLPRPEDYRRKGGILGTLRRMAVRDEYQTARRMYNQKLSEHRHEYLEEDYLAEEAGYDLWRISARVGALQDVDYGQVMADIRQAVEPVFAELRQQGVQGIEPIYTGLVPLVYKAQRSLMDGLVFGFVTDFILITLVMMLAVRDWSAGLILALPSIFPAVVVFGLMGWLGIVVDIGTVMAPSVALGVTVDDVVHFMLKCRRGLKEGRSRRASVMLAYKGCARAMYQSWGVIGLGLSVFALSPFTPTQRFGYLMVSLLTAALVGNLVLLPALLSGPLGALFGRRYRRLRWQRLQLWREEARAHCDTPGPQLIHLEMLRRSKTA